MKIGRLHLRHRTEHRTPPAEAADRLDLSTRADAAMGMMGPAARTIMASRPAAAQTDGAFCDRYGPWAVVTGGSAGIGAEFGRQLASKGLNVVLAARDPKRLATAADHLRATYGVQVRTVPVDLSDPQGPAALSQATKDLDVGLLVNNAGSFLHGAVSNHHAQTEGSLVDLNVRAPVVLATEFASRLSDRGHGGMIFLGSVAGNQGIAGQANYAAGKAYLQSYAEGLSTEMRPSGVDVLVVNPGLTRTELLGPMDLSRSPLPPGDPPQVVSRALHDLGRKTSSTPGFLNRLAFTLARHALPREWNTAFASTVFARVMGYESVDDAFHKDLSTVSQ